VLAVPQHTGRNVDPTRSSCLQSWPCEVKQAKGWSSQLGGSGNAPVRTTSAAMSCNLRLFCWLVRFST
jgi:hypothetical protein